MPTSPRRFRIIFRAGRAVRPTLRLPSVRPVFSLSFRGREAPVGIRFLFMSTSGQRPPPTFAASRQRRDLIIAHSPGWGFQGGGPQPSLFGRFKGKGFLRKGGNRNPPFLKWRSLDTFFLQGKKVSRRRQKKRFGTDRAVRLYTRLPKTHALFIRADVGIRPYEITGKPVRHPFGAMRSSRPTKRAADECP